MNSDRWNRVDKMFHGAVSLPVPERAAYLDRECDGDGP
jgi:hypothetical protein